ncbi:hypothetical protein AYO38_01980 [bacterium SCGC AG-212-C10]|nr:hypothetical protein AYO38_01980 [bacterium SCGC AG-212-C10]
MTDRRAQLLELVERLPDDVVDEAIRLLNSLPMPSSDESTGRAYAPDLSLDDWHELRKEIWGEEYMSTDEEYAASHRGEPSQGNVSVELLKRYAASPGDLEVLNQMWSGMRSFLNDKELAAIRLEMLQRYSNKER